MTDASNDDIPFQLWVVYPHDRLTSDSTRQKWNDRTRLIASPCTFNLPVFAMLSQHSSDCILLTTKLGFPNDYNFINIYISFLVRECFLEYLLQRKVRQLIMLHGDSAFV